MNKEKIKKAKKHYILTTEHELDDNNKRLKEYIEYLEQKESILDKVTDKLKEDINRFDKIINDRHIWGEQKVDFKKYKNYAINLLNIAEGEKK